MQDPPESVDEDNSHLDTHNQQVDNTPPNTPNSTHREVVQNGSIGSNTSGTETVDDGDPAIKKSVSWAGEEELVEVHEIEMNPKFRRGSYSRIFNGCCCCCCRNKKKRYY